LLRLARALGVASGWRLHSRGDLGCGPASCSHLACVSRWLVRTRSPDHALPYGPGACAPLVRLPGRGLGPFRLLLARGNVSWIGPRVGRGIAGMFVEQGSGLFPRAGRGPCRPGSCVAAAGRPWAEVASAFRGSQRLQYLCGEWSLLVRAVHLWSPFSSPSLLSGETQRRSDSCIRSRFR